MMTTEDIIVWLRVHAKGMDFSWRKVMQEAAKRLEQYSKEKHGSWKPYTMFGAKQWACSECQTLGNPQWKRCPVCEAKMDVPNITEQTQAALEKMGRQAHLEE